MEKKYKDVQQELTFLDFWNMIVRNITFVIVTTLSFFILSIIYGWIIVTPDYISTADVMVQVEQDSSSSETNFDLVNAFRLIDTVAELMEKEIIIENAIERLILLGYEGLSVKYIREGLSIRTSSTSYFVNISFVNENTLLAEDAVNAIIDAVIEETDVVDAFPVLTDKIRRTSFASEAIYYTPNKLVVVLIGIVLGATISIGFLLTREVFTSTFRSKEEIESILNIQILGVIPFVDNKEISNGKKK